MGIDVADDARDLRYPIGRFEASQVITRDQRGTWINDIDDLPANLRRAIAGLNGEQLDTPYRPDGWTVRQVIHHLADSHMNAYVRFRLALTESVPTIKPYDEAAWARLPDAKVASIEPSLKLLDSLHERLTILLRSMEDADFQRSFRHPERGEMRLDTNLGLYSWHGRHHVAHIQQLREKEDW